MAKNILAKNGVGACDKSLHLVRSVHRELLQLVELSERIEARVSGLRNNVVALAAAGIVEATPHYQQGKYLYLIHPMRNGNRARDYVGSDEDKIKSALASVDRCRVFKSHLVQVEVYRDKLTDALGVLSRLSIQLSEEH